MYQKIKESFQQAWQPALKSALWLLKIMIPVSIGVTALQYFGVIQWISGYLEPFFRLIGLRGEAALVLVTSAFLNLYSALAVIQSIPFTAKEVTILSLMCLIAHNMVVETAVQKKTGSSARRMVWIRLSCALIAAIGLHLLIPETHRFFFTAVENTPDTPLREVVHNWITSTLFVSTRLVLIVVLLNFLQKLMQAFGIMQYLSKTLAPLMHLFGLSRRTSFLWIIGNVVGLAYGAVILIETRKQHIISAREADRLNHHLAVSHSLLEDTLIFAAIGVPVLWITLPRILLAIAVVWGLYGLRILLWQARINMKTAPADNLKV